MAKAYEIENDEVKAVMLSIAKLIGGALPTGWGFLLMLFEYGTPDAPGSSFYASSADREDAIRMLREWIDRQETR